ncbi:glutathione hydrolase 6 isoform 1-T3 [Discoglossus pictus]
MAPLHKEIRYHKVKENEADDPEEVTVYLYRETSRILIKSQYRETCLRVLSSMLLLVVALGFVLYELKYGDLEAPATPQRPPGQLEQSWNNSPWALPPLQPHPVEDDFGEQDHHEDLEIESGHEIEHHHDHADNSQPAQESHQHAAGVFHHSVAITEAESCSEAAQQILRSEGSVIDAGIAAAFCLSVVHPHAVSLGGVFSSVYYNGTSRESVVLNAMPVEASGIDYGIPLLPQGLWLLHQKFGQMEWSELLAPAITLADGGYAVDSALASAIESNHQKVLSSAGLSKLFSFHNGTLKKHGDSVVNLSLGKTLLNISSAMMDSGLPEGLVQSLADEIDDSHRLQFQEAMSKNSLNIGQPLTVQLPGMTIITPPHPSAGQILSDLIGGVHYEQPILANKSIDGRNQRAYRILFNVAKNKYSMYGASPTAAFPVFTEKSLPSWQPAPVMSNVLIADAHGDVLVMSLSLNSSFGCGFVSPSTGIIMSSFVQYSDNLPVSGPLFWASPAVLLLEENDVLGLAASGGSSAAFSLARTVLNHIYLKKDLVDSVAEHLVNFTTVDYDPWYEYLGVGSHGGVVAVEVHAEHVHVAKSLGFCCYYKGL